MLIPKVQKKNPMYTNGRWDFPTQMHSTKKKIGFIYIIRDNAINRFYLGKKLYRVMRGANSGRESNWKQYCSSSKLLIGGVDNS